MINIDNKTYRNLEEQVGYNTDKVNELSSRLNRQFVDINGIVPDVASLPKDLPNGSYYLVGVSEPYDLYYHVYDRWVNLGVFTFKGDQGPMGAVGPQGEKGPQGERGIEGPMGRPGQTGPQGLRGLQGLQGPKGDRGEKGESGTIFYVVTKLNSVNDLPAAEATPTTNAYLVKSSKQDTQGNPIYDLYIISKQGQTQSWINVGAMTGTNTRIIKIDAPASAKNGTLTLNQLEQIKEPVVNMIQLGDQTYTPGSHAQGYYVYRCLTDDKNLILSINESNGAWTLTSTVLNVTDLENIKTNITNLQNDKQDKLTTENLKTINNQSLLGKGNITVAADTSKLETDIQAVDQRVTNQSVKIEEAMTKAQNAVLMAGFAAQGLDKKQNILEFATTQEIEALF